MENNDKNAAEKLALIVLGAISGIISLGVLAGFIQGSEWLSPLFGILAVLLLMGGGLIGEKHDRDPTV